MYIYIKTHYILVQTNFLLSKQHEVKITQFYGIYDVSRKLKQANSLKDFSGTKETSLFNITKLSPLNKIKKL